MDDFCFNIRTVSGQEYRISTKLIAKTVGGGGTVPEVAQSVFDKWKFIHR